MKKRLIQMPPLNSLMSWATLGLLCSFYAQAQEVVPFRTSDFDISIELGDSLLFYEDVTGTETFEEVLSGGRFQDSLVDNGKPQGHYWLKFALRATSSFDQGMVLVYDRTSYVDLYQVDENGQVTLSKAGSGRKRSEIKKGDNRRYIHIRVKAGETSTFYLKFTNNTDYQPSFGIRLVDAASLTKEENDRTLRDFTLFGAVSILIVYALSLYFIHRYRPYLWLVVHSIGYMMYSFAGRDYLVDLVFPEYPGIGFATPWAMLGYLGLLLLIMSFLRLKEKSRIWYRILYVSCLITLVQMIGSSWLIVTDGLYVFTTKINLYIFIVNIILLPIFVFSIWKKLGKSQRVFAAGILFFIGMLILAVMSWFMIDTLGRNVATAVSFLGPVGQILIFAIALGIQMRQHEVDKNKALNRLNTVLTSQKEKVEQEVVERTAEINQQKLQLEERNERIETLFREIHHRVKNNLQLISSLLNMQQEWSSTEDPAKAIEDSRSRVVAMSMIHQFLYRTDDISTIDFRQYAEELASKLDDIQVEKVPYELSLDFDKEYVFDIDTSISLGLILNELITNSYKHALVGKRRLEMTLKMQQVDEQHYAMEYADSGEPISQPFEEVVKKGFGLRLASRLSRQLQGSFQYEHNGKNRFKVEFASKAARELMADGV